ncbi:MAG: hypothetical protein KIT09_22605 [Bryobacteraceae bacterium]|nr:hypothetical protein [Bryobacteraceae bacterium]
MCFGGEAGDADGAGGERDGECVCGSAGVGGSTGLRYFPYGEERGGTTAQERDKFGTYFRDGVTNLDYAQQRYYSSTAGRFLSADPLRTACASSDRAVPISTPSSCPRRCGVARL